MTACHGNQVGTEQLPGNAGIMPWNMTPGAFHAGTHTVPDICCMPYNIHQVMLQMSVYSLSSSHSHTRYHPG